MKRCRGNPSNLLTVSHWMLQKFCNFSCTVCRRNSETTSPLDVAEILLPLTHWMLQKFCNHLYTGCCRNSVTTNTLSVAEILQPLIHWVSQRFCDNSYAGCCRNSATTYSLGVAEILQPLIHQVLQKGVAEILQQLIHWVSQKFCNHSFTSYYRNSVNTHTLNVTETLWPLIHCCKNSASSYSLDVSEIHSWIQEYNSLSLTSQ